MSTAWRREREQSTQRQNHLLAEAGMAVGAEGVRMFSDPATSSKIPALTRAGFQELAGYARPGDTLTISELYRLCRDLADILAVRTWSQQHGVKLRVLSGPLSTITDLAATDATTTMLVNIVVSVGQFQRDLQNELTREGLTAAWAQGAKSGRRSQVAKLGAVDDVRAAFREGVSIAALAREHGVSRGAIRTAVADLLPDQPERPVAPAVTAPQAVLVEVPGKIARYLDDHDGLGDSEQRALVGCRAVAQPRGTARLGTQPGLEHGAQGVTIMPHSSDRVTDQQVYGLTSTAVPLPPSSGLYELGISDKAIHFVGAIGYGHREHMLWDSP